jgi:ubiquinone/menaquinone biosynthesis C-methylase UbiE
MTPCKGWIRIASPGWQEYIGEVTTIEETGWVRGFSDMMKLLPKRIDCMLEVGCSTGRWIRWYKDRFSVKSAYGLDIYDITKIHGKSNYDEKLFHFLKGDARQLPYEDQMFDFVYSLGLVEHFKSEADVDRIIAEQARVLKKGGYIVTTFPTLSYRSLMYWRMKLLQDPRHDYKHYHTTLKNMKKVYERHGIELIDGQYLGWFFEPFRIPKLSKATPFSQICCMVGRKR